jgi:hypothetical protein
VIHKLPSRPNQFPVHPLFLREHEDLLEHVALQ